MRVNFFDDPLQTPKPRDEVRLKKLGIYVYPDRRRVAIGFDVTPFLERPSIEVKVVNGAGEAAANLSIIELLETNFTMTMHLRDLEPANPYQAQIEVYYASPDEDMLRQVVDTKVKEFDVTEPGEK